MFVHSYSESSQEHANMNNMLQCIVQSSAGDEMTWLRVFGQQRQVKCSWLLYYDAVTAATSQGWTKRLDSSQPTDWWAVAAAATVCLRAELVCNIQPRWAGRECRLDGMANDTPINGGLV